MKRRNREDRARQRIIQEYHLTKPFQRAMDFICKEMKLSYQIVLQSYQYGTVHIPLVDLSDYELTSTELRDDGTFEMTLAYKPIMDQKLFY